MRRGARGAGSVVRGSEGDERDVPSAPQQEASAKPLEAAANQRRIGSGWSQLPPAEQPADAVKAGREPAELLRVTERRAKRLAASGQLLRSEADTGAEAFDLAVGSGAVSLSEGNRRRGTPVGYPTESRRKARSDRPRSGPSILGSRFISGPERSGKAGAAPVPQAD